MTYCDPSGSVSTLHLASCHSRRIGEPPDTLDHAIGCHTRTGRSPDLSAPAASRLALAGLSGPVQQTEDARDVPARSGYGGWIRHKTAPGPAL